MHITKQRTPGSDCSRQPHDDLSGVLPDRIDIHIEVPHVPLEKLSDKCTSESSIIVHARVKKTRVIQRERFKGCGLQTNSDIRLAEIRQI